MVKNTYYLLLYILESRSSISKIAISLSLLYYYVINFLKLKLNFKRYNYLNKKYKHIKLTIYKCIRAPNLNVSYGVNSQDVENPNFFYMLPPAAKPHISRLFLFALSCLRQPSVTNLPTTSWCHHYKLRSLLYYMSLVT